MIPRSVRAHWPLFAGLAAFALVVAAAISLRTGHEADVTKTGPVAPPITAPPVITDNAPAEPKVVEEDYSPWIKPSKEMVAACEAATGHRRPFYVEMDGERLGTSPMRIIQLPFSKVLITGESVEPRCHLCQGAIGIYYFREEAGKVVVTGRWPRAIKGWGWGELPSWQLTRKFTSLPAIWEAGHEMHMGIESKGASITELRPNGPAKSDPIDTSLADEGAPDPNGRGSCIVHGEIVNIRPDVGFDVRVTGDVTAVDRYRKRNGRFVAISKIDWSDPCPRRGPPPPDSGPPSVG